MCARQILTNGRTTLLFFSSENGRRRLYSLVIVVSRLEQYSYYFLSSNCPIRNATGQAQCKM